MAVPSTNQPNPFDIAQQVSDETGYQYEQVNDIVWRYLFTGRYKEEIDVLAIRQGHLFIVGTLIVSRQQLELDEKLAAELLLLNNNLDRVKVGFNQEDMLFVRSDLSTRTLDAQELKENIDQISAATDYIFSIVQPHLKPAPQAPDSDSSQQNS